MLSVIDKPTIQYIAEELSEAGIDDIIIVIAPGSDIIKRHFGTAPELEKRLLEDGKTELYNIERQTLKKRLFEHHSPFEKAILSKEEYKQYRKEIKKIQELK